MRVYEQGTVIRVTVAQVEVEEFKRSYPCSNLPDRSFSFQFQRDNGDLLEYAPSNIEGDGILALIQDARNYATEKLDLGWYRE